ncbi:MAG TPA: site-specific DNA-methyltransferase [Methanomicrobiales archaeon]|nr:site-specific DNA-methyltransferase [Methanomicrobiales archaeon]
MKPYFAADGFELYHADSLGFLEGLPEDSVDLIFADPPYRLSNDGFTCHAGRRAPVNKGSWDESRGTEEDFRGHLAWIRACQRVLAPAGSIWISGTYHSIYACGYALQIAGYHLLNDICWFKPNAPPNLSGRYFTASHETLLWAAKGPECRHTFNYDLVKNGSWPGDALKRPHRQMRSVWSIPAPRPGEKRFGRHPTQKPLELLLRIILASSKKGDLVLDPFTGSSTTGLACTRTGRRFIGVDREEKFLELSVKRYLASREEGT